MSTKGIDISTWQEPSKINYDQLAKEIDFVILRAGYTGHGTGVSLHKDDAFEDHYTAFHQRNVPIGVYWYSCANTKAKGVAEAKKCLEIIGGKTISYPVYIDSEDNYHQRPSGKNAITDALVGFCETIEAAGYYTGIYASSSWFNDLTELDRLSPYDFWVAQWSSKEPTLRHGIWQYSSKGSLSGYSGNLDMNYAYKDYPTIIRSAGLNQLASEQTKPADKKSIDTLAQEVIQGLWGNGDERKQRLTDACYSYSAVQAKVNEKLSVKKSVDTLAREVIRGDWGNGQDRKNRLTKAGYDYVAVQKRVNELL
jgi:lysozyme